MMRAWGPTIALLATAPLLGAAAGDAPADYATRVAVMPAAGAVLQRVALPAAILAAARTPGLADLRLFDATGRALPIAPADLPEESRRTDLRPLPILAATGGVRVTGVSLRMDAAGRPQGATLAGAPTGQSGSAIVGTLLDTRGVAGAALALDLAADLPAGQPVTFIVEASADLDHWRALGRIVAYRAPETAAVATKVPLDGSALSADYLRVTWTAGSRLLTPVVVRGAALASRSTVGGKVMVDADAPPPGTDRAVAFAVPFATAVTAVRVRPNGGETVVPIRVLGRDDAGQPWTLLGSGLAAADRIVVLSGASARSMRIEPVGGAGFAAAPAIRFALAPRAILFLAAGRAPYLLAAGRVAATDASLSRAVIGEGETPGLALAADPPVHLRLAPIAGGGDRRVLLLWAVLIAATAVLGGLAWLVWKQARAADMGS